MERQKDDLTEVFLRCNIENLCILLLHCCQGTPVPCSDISSEAIRRAVLYIHTRYREPITLAQAAEHAGLSASYFSGIFHKAMGVTFARYLLDYRLMIAERYLRQADLSVKQIASACGFRSCSHFNVVFKQRFGCAPGAWQRPKSLWNFMMKTPLAGYFSPFGRGADEEREKRLYQEMKKHRNRDTFNQMVKVSTGASYIVTFWMRPLSSTMKHTLSASR